MKGLLLLLALGGLVWFWLDSLRGREQALRAGVSACGQMDVQLLDYTVELARLRLARDRDGRLRWRRTYNFEFSLDGGQRCPGQIVLLGGRVESVCLEHPDGRVLL